MKDAKREAIRAIGRGLNTSRAAFLAAPADLQRALKTKVYFALGKAYDELEMVALEHDKERESKVGRARMALSDSRRRRNEERNGPLWDAAFSCGLRAMAPAEGGCK